MTLEQIKQAVEAGKTVHWASDNYVILKDKLGQWLVHSTCNDCFWGLTWLDGVTVNGTPEQFYIGV